MDANKSEDRIMQQKIGKRAVDWSLNEVQTYIGITLDGGILSQLKEGILRRTHHPPVVSAGVRQKFYTRNTEDKTCKN